MPKNFLAFLIFYVLAPIEYKPSLSTIPDGACCIQNTGGQPFCYVLTESQCNSANGNYKGDSVPCDPSPCACSWFCGHAVIIGSYFPLDCCGDTWWLWCDQCDWYWDQDQCRIIEHSWADVPCDWFIEHCPWHQPILYYTDTTGSSCIDCFSICPF